MRTHTVMDSPIGPLTLVADDGVLSGLFMEISRYPLSPERAGEPDPGGFDEPVRQLGEYFAGQRTEFDLELSMAGTPFQLRVWKALRDIPYGETESYGELAQRIGRPTGARAVGLANGRNPVSIIVPCHRVIGSSGSLTGYGGGIERKQFLLAFEQRVSGKTLI
jgi:methylated-DNA-[protein]-cysteine S-methyltransferase